MANKFPLQSLLDLSQLRLDEATRRLGQLISGEQEAHQRLAMLVQYREEYQARFVTAAQGGLAPREWQNFRDFLAKLDDAVRMAGDVVDQSKQKTAAGQRDWLSQRGRVQAYDTLSRRHEARVRLHAFRREQKASDEFAARNHLVRNEEGDD